jgi:hypothetical protein
MPIEIKEIIIRTRIEDTVRNPEQIDFKKLKQDILQECLKQMKQRLQKQLEP